jgi:hypothetical protein
MVLLGVGTLLPFNVFITERTFYEVSICFCITWHGSAYLDFMHAPSGGRMHQQLSGGCVPRQVRAQQPPTWRAAADNFENLLVLVFQLWCATRPPSCHQNLGLFIVHAVHEAKAEREGMAHAARDLLQHRHTIP